MEINRLSSRINTNYNQSNKMSQIQNQPNFMGVAGVSQKIYAPTVTKPMKEIAANVVNNFSKRVGEQGQFLNWVNLPKQQLARIDYFYDIAAQMKKTNGNKPLTVLGIGGSKHTVENLLGLLGGGKTKVFTYSGIDKVSYSKFLKENLGGDVRNSNYAVVSKSGTTFETADGYTRIKNELVDAYKKDGLDEEKAIERANKHFVAVSDKSEKSTLRVEANKNSLLGQFFIHDDVGGRYSILDDQGMLAMAYAGISKTQAKQVLKGAMKMTEACLNTDIKNNPAMKKAVFYTNSFNKGHKEGVQQLFGDIFESTQNWEKQLHFESLKDNMLSPGIVPESMHYAAESHYAPQNKYHFILTTPKFPKGDAWYNPRRYLQGITNAYKNAGPTEVETLKLNKENTAISPEAVGAYCQMEHFSTIYKGMMRRAVESKQQPDVLPEVLQPNVETYKNEFKGGVLHPGQ